MHAEIQGPCWVILSLTDPVIADLALWWTLLQKSWPCPHRHLATALRRESPTLLHHRCGRVGPDDMGLGELVLPTPERVVPMVLMEQFSLDWPILTSTLSTTCQREWTDWPCRRLPKVSPDLGQQKNIPGEFWWWSSGDGVHQIC